MENKIKTEEDFNYIRKTDFIYIKNWKDIGFQKLSKILYDISKYHASDISWLDTHMNESFAEQNVATSKYIRVGKSFHFSDITTNNNVIEMKDLYDIFYVNENTNIDINIDINKIEF